jgi:circadian clock protein KaiC
MNTRSARPSGIPKTATGIAGFDQISHGGLPRGRTTLVVGGPGAGKTVFALQTLVNGARDHGEPAIFVAFEENSRRIVANAATFGWDLVELEREHLFFLDAYLSPTVPMSGQFDLTGILSAVGAKAKEMGATRLVFDGLDVLLSLLDDPVAERREVYRLHEWLAESGMSALVTAKSEPGDPEAVQRYGYLQFMADCVIVLHHRLSDRIPLRGLRLVKYRGSGFEANEFPFVIGEDGIEVFTFADADLSYEAPLDRVPSGIPRLDTMLDGGYYRGASVLITGAPGTAKTTLSGAFAHAACATGERVLYVSFDEPASQIVRNLASVGIDVRPFLDSGQLRIVSARTEAKSAEEHLMGLKRVLQEHRPAALIVDPISALTKRGGQIAALDASLRLLDHAKARGITTVCTSLVEGNEPLSEATPLQISTLADTWIHLSYLVRGGERNRALTIVKSRGMAHSNQVRELILGRDRVSLADVYTAGGQVVLGTARWQREAEEKAKRARARREAEHRRREVEAASAALQLRMKQLEVELEANRAELMRIEEEAELREQGWSDRQDQLLDRRSADEDTDRSGLGVGS